MVRYGAHQEDDQGENGQKAEFARGQYGTFRFN
jgi:hypothetical protein